MALPLFSGFSIINDIGRLRSRSDCGNVGTGRLDSRWITRRSGETRTDTKHAPGEDEKAGDLTTFRSGRNQRSRSRARRCADLRVELAASNGMRLEVRKRERVEHTVIDPILALFTGARFTPWLSSLNAPLASMNRSIYRS
jgi:hypothetical protein